jgi:hypothetical protein
MDATDVRDLGGRLSRLFVSAVIGIAGAVIVAVVLPERDHTPNWVTCFRRPSGIDPALVIAGAVGLTLALYAALGALGAMIARPRRHALPRAVLLLRR